MVETRGSRWTPQEDALFRQMAEANVRPEIIATKLNRTVHAVKAGAYMIGLPLKWFYCRGSKANHFCGTSQGTHTEDSIETDCQVSQTDMIRRPVELGLKAKA